MTVQLEYKALPTGGVQVVDEDKGIVRALVAITGVVDRVKDRIVPGAFEKSLAKVTPKGAWGHDWNSPVSRTLEAKELLPGDVMLPRTQRDGTPWPREAGALMIEMQFNLKTARGRDAFEDVKFFGPDQEWSIGYQVVPGKSRVEFKSGVREIQELDAYEYSPVLFGAAAMAGTISVKSAQAGRPTGMGMGTTVEGRGAVDLKTLFDESRQEVAAELAMHEAAEVLGVEVEVKRASSKLGQNRGNAETLRKYWESGEGAAKIAWGTPGDFTRCVALVTEYMGPNDAKGYCNLRHKGATGAYAGQKALEVEELTIASLVASIQTKGLAPAEDEDAWGGTAFDVEEWKARRFSESQVVRGRGGKFARKPGGNYPGAAAGDPPPDAPERKPTGTVVQARPLDPTGPDLPPDTLNARTREWSAGRDYDRIGKVVAEDPQTAAAVDRWVNDPSQENLESAQAQVEALAHTEGFDKQMALDNAFGDAAPRASGAPPRSNLEAFADDFAEAEAEREVEGVGTYSPENVAARQADADASKAAYEAERQRAREATLAEIAADNERAAGGPIATGSEGPPASTPAGIPLDSLGKRDQTLVGYGESGQYSMSEYTPLQQARLAELGYVEGPDGKVVRGSDHSVVPAAPEARSFEELQAEADAEDASITKWTGPAAGARASLFEVPNSERGELTERGQELREVIEELRRNNPNSSVLRDMDDAVNTPGQAVRADELLQQYLTEYDPDAETAQSRAYLQKYGRGQKSLDPEAAAAAGAEPVVEQEPVEQEPVEQEPVEQEPVVEAAPEPEVVPAEPEVVEEQKALAVEEVAEAFGVDAVELKSLRTFLGDVDVEVVETKPVTVLEQAPEFDLEAAMAGMQELRDAL